MGTIITGVRIEDMYGRFAEKYKYLVIKDFNNEISILNLKDNDVLAKNDDLNNPDVVKTKIIISTSKNFLNNISNSEYSCGYYKTISNDLYHKINNNFIRGEKHANYTINDTEFASEEILKKLNLFKIVNVLSEIKCYPITIENLYDIDIDKENCIYFTRLYESIYPVSVEIMKDIIFIIKQLREFENSSNR